MLINLRNALMAGKRLPYDAEVEYLESTGTQYIDTGVSGAEHNLIITAGIRINTFSAYAGLFGNYVSESANCYRLILAGADNGRAYANCGYRASGSHIINNFTLNAWHTVVLNGVDDRCFCDCIESTKTTRFVQGTANSNTILVCTSGGPAAGTWSKQISAFKVELNGVLVRDYIPVRVGTTGYMYDRVSGKLFGNAGSGDFVLGPDVVPVEYIESHGTEYIDTGFKANNSTRVAVDFEQTNVTANSWILGARNGTSSATDKFALFYGNNSSYAMIGSALGEFSGTTIKTGRHLLDMSLAGGVVVDSQIVATYSASEQAEIFSATYAMVLFNLWNGSLNSPFIGKYYACDFWDNGDPVRKFRPVRVGTDATSWEGAMMDVLTRRIYRNAGTGAFAYGNDLKYPIPAE